MLFCGKGLSINVTSFSSISYCCNSEYQTQKHAQSGNIHSIILYVHVSWQSAQNFPFNWETRQGEARIPDRGFDPYPHNNGKQT